MTTWTDIFPELDGPPVTGLPAEFDSVANSFTTMNTEATEILTQFKRIMGDGCFTEIQGAVADPFKQFVENVSDKLGSLPDVSAKAAGIFSYHADQLTSYRTAADKALAQAVTKWGEVKTARTNVGTATTKEQTAKTDVDNTPPDADASDAQGKHDQAQTDLGNAKTTLTTKEGELAAFTTTWSNIRGDEGSLRHDTKTKLDDVDLHSLEDPGWFDSFCEAAVDVLKWAYEFTGLEDLVDLIDAIAHGDWAKALWKLHDLMDKLFTVLSIVALFVAPELLLVIIAVIAVVKLATDVGLYASNTANPETGERISLTDIAFDVVDVVTAGKAAKLHEASTLTRGKEAVNDGRKYLDNKAGQYTKSKVRSQQRILTKYGIPSTTTTIIRAPQRARYVLNTGSKTKFYIRSGQQIAGPGVKLYQGGKQGVDVATDGPDTSSIDRTMGPDQRRPYFTAPDPDKVIDLLTEIPVK
ncbi:MAG: hypothetical protein ABIR68_03045 [Ilumatobacteraceae bacterium]